MSGDLILTILTARGERTLAVTTGLPPQRRNLRALGVLQDIDVDGALGYVLPPPFSHLWLLDGDDWTTTTYADDVANALEWFYRSGPEGRM